MNGHLSCNPPDVERPADAATSDVAPLPAAPTSRHERDARCSRSIDDFVSQRMTADDFSCGFCKATGGAMADPELVGVPLVIRKLCEAYSNGLPSGADYRVSAEQFRLEVRHVASPTRASNS